MGFEIDFLPVGEESSGGDAIALRYGNLLGRRDEQTVIVIDGGYTDDGDALVEHIGQYYGTDHVDLVVSTHPDQDHINGLRTVVRKLSPNQLWMHLPWMHDAAINAARSRSFRGMSQELLESFSAVSELESVARESGVEIVEPFAGLTTTDGLFRVLGPSREYYQKLLIEMEPQSSIQQKATTLESLLRRMAEGVAKLVPESWDWETLSDDVDTSPRNNSSAVCLLTVDNYWSLFTGDAGISALTQVADVLETYTGWLPGTLNLVQVPHHGSRRNVGPSVLNRILGSKTTGNRGQALVSAPAKNPEKKHPAKKTVNAFTRRGYGVCVTQGRTICESRNAPARVGWGPLAPLPFYHEVEEGGDN